jgi:hypothetical protein
MLWRSPVGAAQAATASPRLRRNLHGNPYSKLRPRHNDRDDRNGCNGCNDCNDCNDCNNQKGYDQTLAADRNSRSRLTPLLQGAGETTRTLAQAQLSFATHANGIRFINHPNGAQGHHGT